MSDIMRPIPFSQLMNWIIEEHKTQGAVFGVRKMVTTNQEGALPIFDERIETPFGPAAGPNTQLAQNIVASYVAGSRFFELKTVQVMDGEELSKCVNKPCIVAQDECYNCEWSTELEVPQAFAEYVKAWFACHLIAREYGLGSPDGFVFNMSVGYDLEGIKSPKVDAYIEGMKDASGSEVWNECRTWALANLDKFEHVDAAFVESIPARVSNSITESTLHGCPPAEIERIATYLITEKGLNTYIKCNPTLLGYEFARQRLNELGFDYIVFDDTHFREDLQWADAVPMFERLIVLCAERGLEFGVKLTNTFPVDVTRNELPSTEMYMSGRSLFSLTIEAARRITEQFDGKLRISYSGGATVYNIRALYDASIWPVTLATDVLKPGGYERFSQMAGEFADLAGNAGDGGDGVHRLQVLLLLAYAHTPANDGRGLRRGVHLGSLMDQCGLDTRDVLYGFGSVVLDGLPPLVKAVRVLGDEFLVVEAIVDQAVGKGVEERDIATVLDRKVDIGDTRSFDMARVGDDNLATLFFGSHDTPCDDGVRIGRVIAEEENAARILHTGDGA